MGFSSCVTKVLASVSLKSFRGRRCRCKCEASPGCGSGAVKLLVDADSHSVEDIKDVINSLEETGKVVYTTVFAEPRRINNKKWSQFFQDGKITFHPVERNPSRVGEANDDAIDSAIRTCVKDQSIALLTSDSGFSEAITDATDTGKRVVVFIPSKRLGVIERYRRLGVEVKALRPPVSVFPRVRAICVQMATGMCSWVTNVASRPILTASKLAKICWVTWAMSLQPLATGISNLWFTPQLSSGSRTSWAQ